MPPLSRDPHVPLPIHNLWNTFSPSLWEDLPEFIDYLHIYLWQELDHYHEFSELERIDFCCDAIMCLAYNG